MQVLLYQQKIDDKKHKITFDKDKLSYRGKTFDCVVSKAVQPLVERALEDGLHYPLALDIENEDYFTKFVHYKRNDGTTGTKTKVVITGVREITQGVFESKSLDEVVDIIEAEQED